MNSQDSLTIGQLSQRMKSLFASAKEFRARRKRPLVRSMARQATRERQLELDLWASERPA